MAVTERVDVLVASLAKGARASTSAKSARLSPRSSGAASKTHSARLPRGRASATASHSSRESGAAARRPFERSIEKVSPSAALAPAAAPGWGSTSNTGAPAWRSSCVMPLPMVPAPRTTAPPALQRSFM